MGRKKGGRDEEGAAVPGVVAGKSKKKNVAIDDDEYSVGTELSEETAVQEEKTAPLGGKKKGKKGKKSRSKDDDDDDELEPSIAGNEDDGEGDALQFGGKKKGKGKGKKSSSSGFDLLGDDGSVEDEDSGPTQDKDSENGVGEDDVVAFTGKKKPAKSKKGGGKSMFSSSVFDAIGDASDEVDGDSVPEETSDNDDEPVLEFAGKKKPSKSTKKGGKGFTTSAFDLLDEEESNETKEDDEDFGSITFTGKKKKSSKPKNSGNTFSAVLLDDVNDSVSTAGDDSGTLDEEAITFSGKKKSSKQKTNNAVTASEVDPIVDTLSVTASTKQAPEDAAETSKNKKKKKKNTRTAQEEEDLDKILAELGEAPLPAPKPSPVPVPDPVEPITEEKAPSELEPIDVTVDKEAEGGLMESAAAKKKKKKKEKEREKKAAAASTTATVVEEKPEESKNETKAKATDKKVPKHVREMQEKLARAKEIEERKKREEEEKLRKEEEEHRRLEELEKMAEEKKRLKKEKEKEKLLKKKQEGKYFTPKQKEEQRRLENIRNQFIANSGGVAPSAGGRPKYNKKKSKVTAQANGTVVAEATECEETKEQEKTPELAVLETEMVEVGKSEEVNLVDENEVEEEADDDEEWDAKSWDDADLKLPGISPFADEEVDSETEHVVKNEASSARAAANEAGSNLATRPAAVPVKPKKLEGDILDKLKQEVQAKQEVPKLNTVTGGVENLRSPICCIMGHVDTGKTKLLDCIRGTSVQEGEAGGITQQIGATYFPAENIREKTKELKADAKLNVPGLLVIDTPGHESFTNLRSRGSGLCDLAILVVDIMHGLEPQTIESLNLLKMRNTDFIVALNKVDRLYGWKATKNAPIRTTMKKQSPDVKREFNDRLTQVRTEFMEQGINTALYYENREMGDTISIVPTSAISGEGIPDMLLLLVQWAQKSMIEKLTYQKEVQCTVLEVKVIEGHGTTIDVVLVNGVLHEGDQIVVCGMQGPIVTTIRALLTPHPMKELRVKGTYLHHKEIKAAQGIKITAQGLEHAIAGTALYVVGPDDVLDDVKESAMEDVNSVMSRIDKSGEGVYVQASTLGSLEALLEFLKTPVVSIPVSGIGIGPVHKKDVMKASVMLEKKKEYATILAFDVKITSEARELADEAGVKIFTADIIYHLFDQFKAYIDNLKEEKKKEAADEAVFPCVLKIMPNCVFNKKDPIVLGVEVIEGIAKIGTPLCIPSQEFIDIGRIASVENNHKAVDYAKKGDTVAIKIVGSNSDEQQKMFGRHFFIEDELVSHISRRSIDILKANYRNDLSNEEWKLLVKLKNIFKRGVKRHERWSFDPQFFVLKFLKRQACVRDHEYTEQLFVTQKSIVD